MAAVTGQEVADFLGRGDDLTVVALAEGHASAVTMMAKAYTRGRGFTDDEPNAEIEAVIVCATARLTTNPGQLPVDNSIGPFIHSIRGGFTGWTLAEQAVLNRYRARAM